MDNLIYRGETIERMGKGFLYGGLLWPQLEGLSNYIDNIKDGTKKSVLVKPKTELPKINVNYFPNEK